MNIAVTLSATVDPVDQFFRSNQERTFKGAEYSRVTFLARAATYAQSELGRAEAPPPEKSQRTVNQLTGGHQVFSFKDHAFLVLVGKPRHLGVSEQTCFAI